MDRAVRGVGEEEGLNVRLSRGADDRRRTEGLLKRGRKKGLMLVMVEAWAAVHEDEAKADEGVERESSSLLCVRSTWDYMEKVYFFL